MVAADLQAWSIHPFVEFVLLGQNICSGESPRSFRNVFFAKDSVTDLDKGQETQHIMRDVAGWVQLERTLKAVAS
eukprot:COSAG04_NODE_2975_length_3325_cov_1.902356_4_plen_74_part_01